MGLLIGLVMTLAVYYGAPPRGGSSPSPATSDPHPRSAVFDKAAVAADAGICSTIGADILRKGGSVVDAGISTTLCAGVVQSHRSADGNYHHVKPFENPNNFNSILDLLIP